MHESRAYWVKVQNDGDLPDGIVYVPSDESGRTVVHLDGFLEVRPCETHVVIERGRWERVKAAAQLANAYGLLEPGDLDPIAEG